MFCLREVFLKEYFAQNAADLIFKKYYISRLEKQSKSNICNMNNMFEFSKILLRKIFTMSFKVFF